MRKIFGVFVMLFFSTGVLAQNQFLDINPINCNKIDAHGLYEKEAIARAYKVPISSVQLVAVNWGPNKYGAQGCNLVFDTAKGPKSCNVFNILTSDKGKTAFGLAVPQKEDNPVCF